MRRVAMSLSLLKFVKSGQVLNYQFLAFVRANRLIRPVPAAMEAPLERRISVRVSNRERRPWTRATPGP